LEQRFGVSAANSKSKTFTFTTSGTSRLFEAGFSIEQVSLVTGHKDWKMLRRYTHLKPEALHNARARKAT
jgi:site-specific recombinase XerD